MRNEASRAHGDLRDLLIFHSMKIYNKKRYWILELGKYVIIFRP